MTQPDPVNILKLNEDELLARLGQGDWLIALPDNLPPLTVTVQWRRDLQALAGKRFVRWVMAGIDHVFTHDGDPPWDSSGRLRQIAADPLTLLTRHETLAEWADHEYTGHSRATYVSGCGLGWNTYKDEMEEDLESEAYQLLGSHCMAFWDFEEMSELFMDSRWDHSDLPLIVLHLFQALGIETLQLSTAEAWQRFQADVLAENEEKRLQSERHWRMMDVVRQFWEYHFPDLIDMRIEMPQFQELGLEARIREVLADADPDIVRMMVELPANHLPGLYSNSVTEYIKALIHQANQ